jgi:hypothetical protein
MSFARLLPGKKISAICARVQPTDMLQSSASPIYGFMLQNSIHAAFSQNRLKSPSLLLSSPPDLEIPF